MHEMGKAKFHPRVTSIKYFSTGKNVKKPQSSRHSTYERKLKKSRNQSEGKKIEFLPFTLQPRSTKNCQSRTLTGVFCVNIRFVRIIEHSVDGRIAATTTAFIAESMLQHYNDLIMLINDIREHVIRISNLLWKIDKTNIKIANEQTSMWACISLSDVSNECKENSRSH